MFSSICGKSLASALKNPLRVLIPCVASLAIAASTLSPEAAQSDYDLLQHALEEAHSGLYRYTPKAEMDRVFAAIRAKLNQPLTTAEFRRMVKATLASIRCGHTGIAPDHEMRDALESQSLFPLSLRVEGRDLVVITNDTPTDSSIRPGMKVIEIDGRKTAEVIDHMLAFQPRDGDIETGRLFVLGHRFPREYWLIMGAATHFDVKAIDGSGEPVSARLGGVKQGDRQKNAEANPINARIVANMKKMEWTHDNLALRFLKDPEIAEIRIGEFSGRDYGDWIESTFRTLREKATKELIIDLRGNGGGADLYGALLVSYLTDKPFRYFDHINMKTIDPSFKKETDWKGEFTQKLNEGMAANAEGGFLVTEKLHLGVAEQQPGKYPFLGKVFVLIDGGSFSTTADVCAVTHHLRRATFIGQETGGAYYGNNSGFGLVVTLPNSKIKVQVPMWEYWNAVPGYPGERRGTPPDHEAEVRVADVLEGRDPGLELALKLAESDR